MKIQVYGAGAWGTALAIHLSRNGHTVTLVPRRPEHAEALSKDRENKDYLPGFSFPDSLLVSAESDELAANGPEALILACPSRGLADLTARLAARFQGKPAPFLVSLAKGLDHSTLELPNEVINRCWPGAAAGVLSGPTFAGEVAAARPTAIVLASPHDEGEARRWQAAFSSGTLRVYHCPDVAGVEWGGCLKNIYAIAAGISDGLGLGDNARAALLTRSLHEMVQLGVQLGGQAATFYGLSGFGDLVATCSGEWSRNRTFGLAIGGGKTTEELLSGRRTVVEGYDATRNVFQLMEKKKFTAPILSEVYAILFSGKAPADALRALMSRDLKSE